MSHILEAVFVTSHIIETVFVYSHIMSVIIVNNTSTYCK